MSFSWYNVNMYKYIQTISKCTRIRRFNVNRPSCCFCATAFINFASFSLLKSFLISDGNATRLKFST